MVHLKKNEEEDRVSNPRNWVGIVLELKLKMEAHLKMKGDGNYRTIVGSLMMMMMRER